MQKKLHIYLILALAFWLLPSTVFAQIYPVTISTQLTQPSPIYLSNYANTTNINSPIKVQLTLNDLTIMNRQVRLKCYFQGAVSFVTNDFVVGASPIYLEGGVPTLLTNVELGPYFEFQNLQGITPDQYAQPLKDGVYTISFEIYDFATNKKLSKKSSVTTTIFQNGPPILNLPANKAGIVEQNIQNIFFSWTPKNINVSNVEYKFSLVEIWNTNAPIQNTFSYTPPLYTTTTRNTSVQYSIAEPQLIPGKTYAWRVKAKALIGAEEIGVFKNNGYSEIFSFKYLTLCNAPKAITVTDVSQDQAKVTWSGEVDNLDYQVNYREKNADSKWYPAVTPREYITISNLKPNTTYEYTVGASCDPGEYTLSNIQEFTTMAQDEIAFEGCGIKPDPNDLANKNPLPQLFQNDVVSAGDFPIVVIKATGSNGTFTGEGYVTLPFLEKFKKLIDAADNLDKIATKGSQIVGLANDGANTVATLASNKVSEASDKLKLDEVTKNSINNSSAQIQQTISNTGAKVEAKANEIAAGVGKYSTNIGEYTRVKVTFNNIGVNTDFKLISGEIIASYDPKWGSMINGDKLVDDLIGDTGTVIPIDVQFEIKSVIKNADGTLTITGTNGAVITQPKIYNDIIITDREGKQYAVSPDAPVGEIKQTGKAAPGGVPTPQNTNGMGSGGNIKEISSPDVTITFTAGNGFYSLDENPNQDPKLKANTKLNSTYDVIPKKDGTNYYVNYKAISDAPNKEDQVTATATFSNGKTTADIVFKTDNGTEIPSSWSGNVATLTLKRTLDFAKESILATVKPPVQKDSVKVTKKYDIAGAMNMWHLASKKVNVTLISINGATLPEKPQDELKKIYNKVGIEFEVKTISKTLSNTWGTSIETGNSDLLNTYTNEQQSITQALITELGSEYNTNTYYMLFLPEKASNSYAGFMPLKRQFGFVFDGTNRTLAHELGHGIFGLRHPFTQYSSTEKSTNLLMDYGTGTVLSHNDWEIMHAPGLQLYQFTQGSSAGAYKINELISGITLDDLSTFSEDEIPFLTATGEVIKLKKNDFVDISFNQDGTIFAFTEIELLKGERYLSAVSKNSPNTFHGFSSNVDKEDTNFKFSYDSKNFDYVYIAKKSDKNSCNIKVEKITLKNYNEYDYKQKNKVDISSLIVKNIGTNEVVSKSSCKKESLFSLIEDASKDSYNQNKIQRLYCEDVLNHIDRYFTPDELEKYSVDEKLKIIDFFKDKDCTLKDNYFSKMPAERYFASCFKNIKENDQELFLQTLLNKNIINFIFDEVETKWLLTGGEDNFYVILSNLSSYTATLNKNKGYKEDQLTLNFDSSIDPLKDAFSIDLEKDKIKFDTSISSTYLLLFDNKPVYLGVYDVVLVNFKVPFIYRGVTFEGVKPLPTLFFVAIANEVANQANVSGANVVVDVISVLSGAELAVQMYKQTAKTVLRSPKFWRHVSGVVLGSGNLAVNTILIDKLQGTDFLLYWNTINLVYGITDLGFNINDFIQAKKAAKAKLVDETPEVNEEFDNLAGELQKKIEALGIAGTESLESARQFVRNNYGQDFLNQITLKYGKENTGALSVLVKRFGNEGIDLLKEGKSLDEIASALVKDRILYRHIGSEAGYLENIKKTGEIPAGYTTYFSADKFDDPVKAISKMQLNSEWTDAVWVAEFDGAQLVGKVEIPKAKWNEASYLEVLTKSFPKWGEGGATQFITKSEINISKIRNLKTGEVIDFTKAIGRIDGKIVNSVAGDIRKFSEYALTNPSKTGLFVESWGYKLTDADSLLHTFKTQAAKAVTEGKTIFTKTTTFGNEYKIETILNTPKNGQVKIYAGWIIKNDKLDELILSSPFIDWVK